MSPECQFQQREGSPAGGPSGNPETTVLLGVPAAGQDKRKAPVLKELPKQGLSDNEPLDDRGLEEQLDVKAIPTSPQSSAALALHLADLDRDFFRLLKLWPLVSVEVRNQMLGLADMFIESRKQPDDSPTVG